MKRPVSIEHRLLLATGIVFFVLILLTEPVTALALLACFPVAFVLWMIKDSASRWLQRSPLGRGWLRR